MKMKKKKKLGKNWVCIASDLGKIWVELSSCELEGFDWRMNWVELGTWVLLPPPLLD